jgi:hypothetical protein
MQAGQALLSLQPAAVGIEHSQIILGIFLVQDVDDVTGAV